jgi:hypothetical protein
VEGTPVGGVAGRDIEGQFHEVNNYFPELAGLIWRCPDIQLLTSLLKLYIFVKSTSSKLLLP